MSTDGLSAYLNDHLAGSVGARTLIEKAASHNAGTPCGDFLRDLLGEVEDDIAALEALMDRCGITRNRLKLAAGWVAERVTRLGFDEHLTGSAPLSRLLELESLTLGVTGKVGLWRALREIAPDDDRLGDTDFDGLIARAQGQLEGLERHRLEAATSALRRDA